MLDRCPKITQVSAIFSLLNVLSLSVLRLSSLSLRASKINSICINPFMALRNTNTSSAVVKRFRWFYVCLSVHLNLSDVINLCFYPLDITSRNSHFLFISDIFPYHSLNLGFWQEKGKTEKSLMLSCCWVWCL